MKANQITHRHGDWYFQPAQQELKSESIHYTKKGYRYYADGAATQALDYRIEKVIEMAKKAKLNVTHFYAILGTPSNPSSFFYFFDK